MIRIQYNMLNEVNSLKSEYDEAKIRAAASNIIGANIFDLADLGFALSYLLSLIKGEPYELCTTNLGDTLNKDLKLVYLVSRSKNSEAHAEIEERFSRGSENLETAQYKTTIGLTTPAQNYVQLAIIKDEKIGLLQHALQGLNPTEAMAAIKLIRDCNPDFIKYQSLDFIKYEAKLDWKPQFLKNYNRCLNVIDSDYAFIMNFMDFLVEYRLNKQDGTFAISVEELMTLAENFAEEYKRNQESGARN
ncbi:MAG: hypothetical protein K2J20_04580 [Bacilli bacterium]|nr:hypothetical protein [Bacilli bacterium]